MARFREGVIKTLAPNLYMPLFEPTAIPAITHLGTTSYSGTWNGTPKFGFARTPLIDHRRNHAVSLNEDGSATDYLAITRVVFGNSSHTIGCLFKTTVSDSAVSYAGDVGQTMIGDTSGDVWQNAGVHGNVLLLRRFQNTLWMDCTGVTKCNDGRWHMAVFIFDAVNTDGHVYLDGALDGSNTSFTNNIGSGTGAGINAIGRGFGGDYFQGQIAEVWASTGVVATAGQIRGMWQKVRRNLSGDRRDLR